MSHRFGLGRGEVGSEAVHEAIDRAKAVEARTRQARREAAQLAEAMQAAHAEHEAQVGRIVKSMEKEAELDLRTAQAKERAEAAEAARAVERARQAGTGTHAEGVAACFRAVQALLHACGMWPKLMAWAPFRIWAEKARGGEVADVEGAIEADRARRRAPASGMER